MSPIVSGGGSGGSQPVGCAYEGDDTLVQPSTLTRLTWDSILVGTELLNRTDPAHPTVLADATYTVALNVLADDSFEDGKIFQAELQLDDLNPDTLGLTRAQPVTTALAYPSEVLTARYPLVAGTRLGAVGFHNCAAAKNMYIIAIVTKG